MSNRYSKILISIAMLIVVSTSTMSVAFAGDLSGFNGLDKLAKEMYGMDLGDCWDCSKYAANRLSENGYKCAIVEGTSDIGVTNHRAVYVYMNEDSNMHCFEAQCAKERGYWQRNWFINVPTTVESFNGYNFDNSKCVKD
ncbi:MAG: hypothetical protein LBC39_00090 [Methanobrevibacter sp.]|jgi:hypothetical protein|nr:hypothetical protein [Candidatus Methanovirga aequatorialis]